MLGEWDVDADGALSEDEFSNGVFGEYDEDGTGIIEEPELTDIGEDMGDKGFWDVLNV
jgi:Ca2+-binding EF-hand superfamily protein